MVKVKKILIIRLSSIGDIILTTPLLRSVRKAFPEARIWFVTKKQFASLLAGSPYIDTLIEFDKSEGFRGLKALRKKLKEEHFDAFIDIHKNWRSRYLKLGSGAKTISTYPKYILRRLLLVRLKINLYKHVRPVFLRYFEAVKKLGVTYDGQGSEIHFPPSARDKAREALKTAGYDFNRPLVILCPGATYLNKKWPSGRFSEVAGQLTSQGAFVVIHGGRDDMQVASEIASSSGTKSLAGTLSLPESAALLKQAAAVIANDSGLLHLAQSQKTPVVGIYGPTTRELGFFPLETGSTVIEVPLYCRPCTPKGLNYCPQKHFRCMKDIPAERVISAVNQFIFHNS
jgi:lipopolysaccharide heptosyltransferase II